MSDDTLSGVDDDGSVVSGARRRQLTSVQKFGVAGLVLVVFLAFIWISQLTKTTHEVKQPDVALAGGSAFNPAPNQPLTPPPSPTLPMPTTLPSPFLGPPGQPQMTAADSPILAYSGGGSVGAAHPLPASPTPGALGVPAVSPAAPSPLAVRLRPTVLDGTKARLLSHPDMLVTEGTIIPCTLQTAIDSQLAGFVKCVLPNDVRGTTGNVVLLDRGTTVVGEIQQGLVQGQNRVFVLWDRAETPDHAVIELASPGTDELGRSGLPGRVNNHFWQRFGSAILLSVIQGGLQTGTALAATSGGQSGTFFNSFQSNGSDVSDTALRASINIPPTLEKNQGDSAAIFVAKDLDFSDVYKLRVSGASYGQ